jgi:hypothetical protein
VLDVSGCGTPRDGALHAAVRVEPDGDQWEVFVDLDVPEGSSPAVTEELWAALRQTTAELHRRSELEMSSTATATAATPSPLPAGHVRVHLEGFPAGAELMQRYQDGRRKRFAPFCKQPCDVPVDVDGRFRISGHSFTIDSDHRKDPAGVIVRLDPGSPNRLFAGQVLLGIGAGAGGVAAVLGAITFLGLVFCTPALFVGNEGCWNTLSLMGYTAAGFFIGGASLALIGLPLWLVSRPSIVQSPGSQATPVATVFAGRF